MAADTAVHIACQPEQIILLLHGRGKNEFKYGKVGIDEVDDSEESELQDSE